MGDLSMACHISVWDFRTLTKSPSLGGKPSLRDITESLTFFPLRDWNKESRTWPWAHNWLTWEHKDTIFGRWQSVGGNRDMVNFWLCPKCSRESMHKAVMSWRLAYGMQRSDSKSRFLWILTFFLNNTCRFYIFFYHICIFKIITLL